MPAAAPRRGAHGRRRTPPGGAQDVTSCWDAHAYPEIWLDQIIAQDRAVDLPIVTHPVGGAILSGSVAMNHPALEPAGGGEQLEAGRAMEASSESIVPL